MRRGSMSIIAGLPPHVEHSPFVFRSENWSASHLLPSSVRFPLQAYNCFSLSCTLVIMAIRELRGLNFSVAIMFCCMLSAAILPNIGNNIYHQL